MTKLSACLAGILLLVVACGGESTLMFSDEELDTARDRIRPAATDAEWNDFIEDCLKEGGSTVWRRRVDNAFEADNANTLDEQIMSDCQAEVIERYPRPPSASTPAEFAVKYELFLRMAQCLEGLGYRVDMPTLDTYIDSRGNWTPYDDIPDLLSYDESTRLYTECPQDPWADVYSGTS
ncbi:MAG: hypothetical protein WB239_08015 [Acidimicrobiia bacterium]